jgi:hypothetical protein
MHAQWDAVPGESERARPKSGCDERKVPYAVASLIADAMRRHYVGDSDRTVQSSNQLRKS